MLNKQVDNFNLIKTLLSYEKAGDFYFLQLIHRKEDEEEYLTTKRKNYVVKNYCLYEGDLDRYKNEIINRCNNENLRADLYLNKRNKYKLLPMFKRFINYKGTSHKYKDCYEQFYNAVKKASCDRDKKWVVKLENRDWEVANTYAKIINDLVESEHKQPFKEFITVPNGIDLITKSFSVATFQKCCYKQNIKPLKILFDYATTLYYYGK